MANDLRTIELLIKATADQGVSQRTVQQLEQLSGSLFQVGKQAGDATGRVISMTEAVGRLTGNQEMLKVADQFRAVAQAATEADQKVTNLETKTKGGAAGGGRFGGGVGPGGLGFAEFLGGMAVRALPQGDVGQVLGSSLLGAGSLNSIISQIQQMSQAAGGLGGALATVLTGLGPVTAAMLVLNTVLKVLTNVNKEAKESVDQAAKSLELYYKTIEEGTRQSVQQQIAKNESDRRQLENTNADLLAKQKELQGQTTTVGRAGFKNENVQNLAQIKAYGDSITENQKKIDQLKSDHDLLTKAYQSESVAARTAVEQTVEAGKIKRTGSSKELNEQMDEFTDRMKKDAEIIAEINRKTAMGTATKEDQATLAQRTADFNQALASLNFDKALLPFVQAREKEEKEIQDGLKAQDERNKALEKEKNSIEQLTQQIDDLQRERDKQVKREDEETAIQVTRTAIEKDFARKIQDAKDKEAEQAFQEQLQKIRDDERKAEAKLTTNHDKQVAKINDDFMKSELKATQDFHDAQADDLAKFNRRYQRALEDMQDKLTDAASRRDVAGFIQAQRDGEKQLRRLSEDFADQDKERVAHYVKERQAARDNRAEQLKDADQNYRDQLQALRQQLQERLDEERRAHQKRVLQSQVLEQQLQQQRESWQIQDQMRRRAIEEQDFNERMVILQQKLMEQRNLMNQILGANAQAAITGGGATTPGGFMSNTINAVGSIAGNFVSGITNFLGGFGGTRATSVPGFTIGASVPSSTSIRRTNVSRYASGFDFVPHDFYPAFLDYGERVLNRSQNEDYSRGAGGNVNVAIYNTVGDVTTKTMLDAAKVEVVQGVRRALRGAGQ